MGTGHLQVPPRKRHTPEQIINDLESFNGKLRDELLDRDVFGTLLEAKVLIERWRTDYNHVRPRSAGVLPSAAPGQGTPLACERTDCCQEYGFRPNIARGTVYGGMSKRAVSMLWGSTGLKDKDRFSEMFVAWREMLERQLETVS